MNIKCKFEVKKELENWINSIENSIRINDSNEKKWKPTKKSATPPTPPKNWENLTS